MNPWRALFSTARFLIFKLFTQVFVGCSSYLLLTLQIAPIMLRKKSSLWLRNSSKLPVRAPRASKMGNHKQASKKYLLEIHAKLHPKIALVGPLGVGKTTMAEAVRLPEGEERAVMNFGMIYPIKIGKMTFDLWDFVLPDNFSPLWNNFVRGCDVFILVVDSTPEGVKAASQFLNLHQREAKSARIAVLCNKQDLPEAVSPDTIKGQLGGIASFGMSATQEDARDRFVVILEEVLDLKKPLPLEFKQILVSANQAISKQDYESAIQALERAAAIAKDYQEMSHYQTLQEKITQMKKLKAEKKKSEEREARKIKAPDKITFNQKVAVKSLPLKPAGKPAPTAKLTVKMPSKPVDSPPKPKPLPIKAQPIGAKPKPQPIKMKPLGIAPPIEFGNAEEEGTEIPEEAAPEEPVTPATAEKLEVTEGTEVPEVPEVPEAPKFPRESHRMLTPKLMTAVPVHIAPAKSRSEEAAGGAASEIDSLAVELSEVIRDLGGSFGVNKCRIFVQKMMEKLGRAPNHAELTKAAQALVARI